MSDNQLSEEFQNALFALMQGLVAADGMRFSIYVPWAQLKKDAGSDMQLGEMVEHYARKFWELDPMHPSLFENTDTVVITNSMIMADRDWQETNIFKEFYQPNGYFHNCDVFLKQNDKIVAVLSLVRKQIDNAFTESEVDLLNRIQPFVAYTLEKIFTPNRIHNRVSLQSEFGLTAREIDVVEIALTGVSNKLLSRHLNISLPTLRTHLQNIYGKVGAHSSAELVSRLLKFVK